MAVAYNKLALLVVVCMVVVSPAAEAITCGAVTRSMIGCLPYLKGGPSPSPAGGCCGGVKSLVAQATTPDDHKTACGCLKQAADAIGGISAKNAAALPGICGVSVPFPIGPSTDCDKIN